MEEEKKQFAMYGRRRVTKEAFLKEMGISEEDIRSPDAVEAERAKRAKEVDYRRRSSAVEEPTFTAAVSGFTPSEPQDLSSTIESLKEDGNAAFQNCNYDAAVSLFTEAINADPGNHILFSNRCASYLTMGSDFYQLALSDAETCVAIDPTWFKGHVRKGDCLVKLRRSEEAMECYIAAQELYPGSKSIKKAIHECKKVIKAERRQRNNPKLQSLLDEFHNECEESGTVEGNTYMAGELAAFRQSCGNNSISDSEFNLSSVPSTSSTFNSSTSSNSQY